MIKLPIFYLSEQARNPTGEELYALVDDEFSFLAKRKLHITDGRIHSPPSYKFRVDGQPKVLSLNRVVFAFSRVDLAVREQIFLNNQAFLFLLSDVPRIKVLSPNKFDCRLENLDWSTKETKSEIPRRSKFVPESALPRGPVFDRADKQNEKEFLAQYIVEPTPLPSDHIPVPPKEPSVLELLSSVPTENDAGKASTIRDVAKKESEK